MTIYIAPNCPPEVEKLIREKHRGERVLGRGIRPAMSQGSRLLLDPQHELSGTGHDMLAHMARLSRAALRPSSEQKILDFGLFSDDSLQTDLIDNLRR